ncbi:MAG: lipopolysaccharide heptosyltransferase II [Candidatus Omnitrophota bacterium]|jgi:lipopolysaccharide heptosyltransferase II
MREPKKILIIRTDRIGDVMLSTPVIKNLRNAYPNAHIAFMARPYTREIVEDNPYLNEIIVYDKNNMHKGILSSVKFSFFLRKKKFDIVFILNPTNRANLITFFAGIPMRVGLNRKMGNFLSHRIEDTKHEGKKHELEYTLDILRKIGIQALDTQTYFPLKQPSEQKIETLIEKLNIKNTGFIIIHPWASCPSKRWPTEHFIELIKLLKEKTSLKIVIIDEQKRKFLASMCEQNTIIDLSEKLNLSDTASLLKRAKLFISNDSGPVHIAASLNTPVISIFGRNEPGLSPKRWRPLGARSFHIHKGCDSKECLAHNCKKGFICLRSITPQEVFNIALSIIGKP